MPDSKSLLEVLALAPIERHTLLTSRDARRKAFTSYLAMREKIAGDFLPIINSAVPFINDHTRGHLERVLYHMECLLERHFPKPTSEIRDIPRERLLTWGDSLILLNALVWHDIGNMYGRDGHAQRVKECFQKVSGLLYDDHLSQYIFQVAEAHSGDDAITKIIPDAYSAGSYQGEDIHLQFLAAVLRFSDELDEDHRRCAPPQWSELDLVDRKSKRFWFFSKVNASLRVKTLLGDHNAGHEVEIATHIPKSNFSMQLHFKDKKNKEGPAEEIEIEALTEFFRRVLKIDKERRYCNKYLQTAYYHPGVRKIRLNLRTHEVGQLVTDGKVYEIEFADSKDPKDLLSDSKLSDLHEFIDRALRL